LTDQSRRVGVGQDTCNTVEQNQWDITIPWFMRLAPVQALEISFVVLVALMLKDLFGTPN
jgi:hypothetical protein